LWQSYTRLAASLADLFAAGAMCDSLSMNIPFTERCVLLTGAGGSIGSALAKAIIRLRPRSLILLDHSEGNLHQIKFDLSVLPGGHVLSPVVGSIRDGALLREIFKERRPETVIHAAAFKHVPLMESNPIQAVQNNSLGTYFLAKIARMHDVAAFVMVSTDKAVKPHSVMGASKRLAELAVLRWTSPRSLMRAVRLGNVLGTQGSVVPLFLEQIAAGGPVTVTHPEVNRYFTSLDEAVELVLLATSLYGESGIFIPNPGEPVRILELAERMIEEAGFEHGPEMPIVMTGLRPGDKMSEEFVSEYEKVDAAGTAKLRLIRTPQPAQEEFDSLMKDLEEKVDRRDLAGVLESLCRLVPEYSPSQVVLEAAKQQQSSPV
jgi:FlaA1/EpsC-like NDP-sugar epimerase